LSLLEYCWEKKEENFIKRLILFLVRINVAPQKIEQNSNKIPKCS